MAFYAAQPARRLRQLVADATVAVWMLVWAVVGILVTRTVAALAGPARQTAETATRLAGGFTDAAGEAQQVPGLGDQLRRPFDTAAGSLGDLVAVANRQVAAIEVAADLAGWLTFLIPVTVVVLFWLPRRLRFHRHSRAAQRFLDSAADVDLFALRALAHQPLTVLSRISPDPVAAWRSGDRAVVTRLAEVELTGVGLRLPDQLRRTDPTAAGPGAAALRLDPADGGPG